MPKRTPRTPDFRELSPTECRAILARHHVGRVAFVHNNRVDVEPIHYVFADDEIVFRTVRGSKFDALQHHPWIAFEVDEVEGLFDWRSVVARGTAYRLEPRGSRSDQAAYRDAVARLRTFLRDTLRTRDPVRFRDVVIGLYVDSLTGRAATTTSRRTPAITRRKQKGAVRRAKAGATRSRLLLH
jgi:nitroimidazol reductase NimA-like FMN-containing flavoprotein (pyridoxamine 5'-phosphate oxidase superfamily)